MALSKPTQITVPFANSGLKNSIPETATGSNLASMQEGFPTITMTDVDQGGMPPQGQDMNGILFDVTKAIQYQQAGGLFPYDATFAQAIDGYPLGALLTSADGTKLYRNLLAGNQSNPENGGQNWLDISDMDVAEVTATDSTTARTLANRFADVINVKDYGAKGDGTTDDTAAIQASINNNFNRTIFFPDGIYIVSDTIITDCEVSKRQSLLLSSGARIKAASDFSGDYVVNLGGRGTPPTYANSDVPVGVFGGLIDANGVANGLKSVGTHCARIQNLNIWGVTDVGLYIGNSNSTSADAYVQNISVAGTDKAGSVGIWIDSNDNEVRDVRVRSCQTGIKMNGGYLANAHPIVGSNNSQSFWESTVGFDVNGVKMSACYADNFGTAFKLGGSYFEAEQLTAYWYEDNSYTRKLFSIPTYFRGDVKVSCLFPENGTNIAMYSEGTFNPGIFPYSWSDTSTSSISFVDAENAWSRFTDRYSDPALLLPVVGKDRVFSGNTGTEWSTGVWYPLVVSQGIDSVNDLNCYIGEDLNFRISYKNSTSSFNPDVSIINNPNNVSLSFCQTYRQSIAGVNAFILWFKITSASSITGIITVSPVSPSLRMQIFSHARAVQGFSPRTGNQYDIPFSGVSTPTGTEISGTYSLSGTVPAVENIVETSFSTTISSIKYSSGYMVAWGKVSYNSTNVPVTFPFEFFEAPSVSLGANVLTNLRYTGLATTGMNLQASTAATITWQANGRWK